MMRKRPTLKTISEMCGLAVPTVSRALNDAPDIARDTKAMVRKVAAEIGYVPDRAGLRLKTGKTHFVAFISETDQIAQDHTGPVVAAIIEALAHTPYNLLVFPQVAGKDPVETVRQVVGGGLADAVILNRTVPQDSRVRFLLDEGLRFVTYGRTMWQGQHAFYDFDNARFGTLAVTQLALAGCQHLAFLPGPGETNFAQDMARGVAEEAARQGLGLSLIDGVTSDDRPEAIVAGCVAHLRQVPQVDGIICPSASKASAVAAAFEAVGRTIGKDAQICAKKVTPQFTLGPPKIQVIHEDLNAAGRFLARAAVHAIEQPLGAPMQHIDVPEMPGLDRDGQLAHQIAR